MALGFCFWYSLVDLGRRDRIKRTERQGAQGLASLCSIVVIVKHVVAPKDAGIVGCHFLERPLE